MALGTKHYNNYAMQTSNSNKSLLIAMGTGANNMVIGYLCERLADRVDFAFIDSLDQREWDKELPDAKLQALKQKKSSAILLVMLGGNTGSGCVETIISLFQKHQLTFSAVVVLPFEYEGSRPKALPLAGKLKEAAVAYRQFDNQTLLAMQDLTMREAMQHADKEIEKLLMEIL